MIQKVTLRDKFELFHDHWHPRIVGQVNDMHVKLTRLKGEFLWHTHDVEDEMFLVVEGQLTIRLRDGEVALGPGEFIVIPHGVEHQPVAKEEVLVMLFEPIGTLNTGNVENQRTVAQLDWI